MRAAAIALLALSAASAHAGAAAKPMRVMSLSECSDQLVLALLPPSRITSVTWLSRDRSASIMAPAAARVAVNYGTAEEVLRDKPDLVIAGAYTTPATRALLKKLRFPLLELDSPDSFDDVRRDTRRVAAAVGEEARGEAMIARMDATLRQLAATRISPVRVAAWDSAGFAATPGSMYDAILLAAGARNVAGGAGALRGGAPDVETVLALSPDMLVRGDPGSGGPGRRADVADEPTVRRVWKDRTVVVSPVYYVCGTPFSADGALKLRAAMRAASARPKPSLPFVP